MQCIDPGRIVAERLLAYTDGAADDDVASHVAECPACAGEVAAYTALNRVLRARLYRLDCPPAQALGERALDLLEPRQVLDLDAHVAGCHLCAAELAMVREAVRGDPRRDFARAPGPLTRILARLLPAPPRDAVSTGVRGMGSDAPMTYTAEAVSVSLTVEPESGATARRWSLLGLVIDERGGVLPVGAPVRLLRAGSETGAGTLDELGNLSFGALEAGTYDLELLVGDQLIAIEGLQVGA